MANKYLPLGQALNITANAGYKISCPEDGYEIGALEVAKKNYLLAAACYLHGAAMDNNPEAGDMKSRADEYYQKHLEEKYNQFQHNFLLHLFASLLSGQFVHNLPIGRYE